jgi:hypothetical protein
MRAKIRFFEKIGFFYLSVKKILNNNKLFRKNGSDHDWNEMGFCVYQQTRFYD